MASPMSVPNERSTVHVSPRPPLLCEVYVDSGTALEGWCDAELLEWTHFPEAGWVGVARYKTSPSGGYVGRFSIESIRKVNPPE